MNRIIIGLVAISLSSCVATMNVTMMSRNSGDSFQGELYGDGTGSGRMTVMLNGVSCSGPASRVASGGQSTVIGSTFAYGSNGATAGSLNTATVQGDVGVKALLSCSDGKGLRCELTGRNLNGGGACTMSDGRTFDIVVTHK